MFRDICGGSLYRCGEIEFLLSTASYKNKGKQNQ